MKLLYLIPSLANSGGMERVLTQKVNFLVENFDYQVTVVTTEMDDDVIPFFSLNPSINVVNFKLFFNDQFNLSFIEKLIGTNKLLKIYKKKLECFIEDNNIDICISMGAKELEFLYKMNTPCKRVYEAHFSKGIRTRTLLENKGNNFIWRSIAKIRELQSVYQTRSLDKMIVLTDKSKSEWSSTNSNVTVIPNPSSIEPTLEFPNYDSKQVITIGRLEYEKGYDLLIKSWLGVHDKHPEWILNIYGNGRLKDQLQSLINESGLNASVHLCGITDKVSTKLLESAFLVLSSRYEGLPMVMLESMACGVPMVAFDCETGPAELIDSDDCGLLVRNGDVVSLTSKINQMIEDPDSRMNMSKVAKRKSESYVIDKIMQKWDVLFKDLVASNVKEKDR